MSTRKLGLQCVSAVGLAAAFYTGCVSSPPARPTGAAGHGGAAAGSGGASGSKNGGKNGNGAQAGSESSINGGSGGSGGSGDNGNGGEGDRDGEDAGGAGAGGIEDVGGAAGSAEDGGAGMTNRGSGGSSAKGGASGKGGSGASAGHGGSSSSGGSSGAGGRSGSGGGSGTGGDTCGGSGQACCSSNSCDADLTCLLGASCSCAKDVFGTYIVRADGVVLQEPTTPAGTQTPVLDANTAQPLTGIISVYDGGDGGVGVGCAARDDGTAWCWRTSTNGNKAGQLGNGTTDTNGATFRATQVLTAANTPLTSVKAIGQGAPCAVTTDGKIYCWGDLTFLVNNGTSLISGYAQPITTDGATPLGGVQQFSAGAAVACALVHNGAANEVWCWGANAAKQLGTGDTTSRKYPTKILGLTNPSQVVVTHSWQGGGSDQDGVCAVDGDNALCWGPNYEAQAGTGDSTNPVTVPTLVKLQGGVTPLSGVTRLYPGHGRVCALHTGNTVWCWGSGLQNYADTIGLTNVVNVGFPGGANYTDVGEPFTYLSSAGIYYYNSSTNAIVPKCGSLQ